MTQTPSNSRIARRGVAAALAALLGAGVFGLSAPQVVGVRYHGGWATEPLIGTTACPWLLVDVDAQASLPQVADMAQWELVDRVRRPTDDNETLLLLRRVGTSQK